MTRYVARLAAVVTCAATALIPVAAAPPEVRTDKGRVSGVSGRHPAVRVFRGIPFAAPPVGPLRWREPQPASAWNGVRAADQFGPRCVQAAGDVGETTARSWRQSSAELDATTQPMDEDCLYLNVWTPAESQTKGLPVIVWVHGGAFRVGAGSLPLYDGEALARKGVVVVTLNYRLGPFGFLAHPELTGESARHSSGNYGLMDVVAALEWVQHNVAAFGGDPNRVTLAGQSAGGFMAQYAVVSRRVPRLFQRAIVQSAPVRIESLLRLAEAERAGQAATATLGAPSVAALRLKSADEIQTGLSSPPIVPAGTGPEISPPRSRQAALAGARPIIDGWYLTEDAWTSLTAGRHKDIDLLVGSNKDEGTFPWPLPLARQLGLGQMTAHEFRAYAHQRFETHADAFLTLYPAGSDAEAAASQLAAFRDEVAWNERFWASIHARRKNKTFLYYFAQEPPIAPGVPNHRATHIAEIPYVFNIRGPLWTDGDRGLADTMSSYWANFARTGDPNARGLPHWPAFEPGKSERQMVFGPTAETGPTLDAARVAVFDALLQNLIPQAAGPPAGR